MTRRRFWEKNGIDLGLPDLSGIEYLLDMLGPGGVGWYRPAGVGSIVPIDWAEIDAFSRLAGHDLEPWEAEQIRLCSAAYVAEYHRGCEPMKVSPVFLDRPDEDPGVALERRKVSDQLEAAFEAMARG